MTIHELIQEADRNKDNELIRRSYVNQVVSALKMQEKVYVMFNAATGYPHVDPQQNIWMFSTKEFAGHAQDFFAKEELKLHIMEIDHEDFKNFLFYLHLWGMERIVLDSGHEAYLVLRRDALLPKSELTDEQKIHLTVVNPDLQRKLLLFFGTLKNGREYPKKQEYLQSLEDSMLREVIKAKFVAPVKKDTDLFDLYVHEEDQSEWLPVFTDFSEMSKIYNSEEWDYQWLNYDEVLEASGSRGIAINRKGMGLWLGQKGKDAIEEFREEEG